MKNILLVGCGSLGSNLGFYLCRDFACDKIHLCDYDTISTNDVKMFSMYSGMENLEKSRALSLILKTCFPHIDVTYTTDRINVNLLQTEGRINIDCRDDKLPYWDHFDVRYSFDGRSVIMDTMSVPEREIYEVKDYLYMKNQHLMNIASLYCVEHFNKGLFSHETFKIYKAESPFSGR